MVVRCLTCLVILLCFDHNDAKAHVKWFSDYNLLCPPRSPSRIVLGDYFFLFCLFVGPLMFAVTYADHKLLGRRSWPFQRASSLTDQVQAYFPIAVRLGVSAFFVAAVSYGGFLLTPELKTEQSWVPVVHLAIAAVVLLPRTAFLAGFGIAGLYAYAVSQFGVYHLLDYPIFLGVAAFLVIHSLFGEERSKMAQNIMRWCTGITLLWAGIEKFAYPEWSFVLLTEQPAIAFGLSPEFYMVAAGFVEFCCAYLLIAGSLSARASAVVLQFFFISAIYYFGVIDAIGHSVIIVVLSILILAQNPLPLRFQGHASINVATVHTAVFFAALFFYIGLYSGAHYLSYASQPSTPSLHQSVSMPNSASTGPCGLHQ